MKYTFSIIIVFLVFCSVSLFGQSPELLKAEGKIPKEFITSSSTKYKKQVEALNEKKAKGRKNKKEKKSKQQFLLESNFSIDDILQSGLVLFNDPASVYVNQVLENLPIKDDRTLQRKKPRAYILNTSAVNAFATDQGIIFVTLGLLANLQNEAQLAFILSHELIHIKHQHSINKFVRSKEIDRKKGRSDQNVNQVGVDRKIFSKSMYSRKLEEEADDEGLDIFLKSQYDPQVITNTFKLLYYSYLPFEDFPFEKSFFEDENFILPENLWLEKTNEISAMEENEEEEKKSSHPSSRKRLEKLESRIASFENSNKKAFILPKETFLAIQKKARYQIPFINLYAENFPEAIYTSFLMLKEYPEDMELKKVIGKSLYMMLKHNKHSEDDVDIKGIIANVTDEVEGSVHQLYHLLAEMDNKEVAILALKYNWELYQTNKEDEEFELLIDDLFLEFADEFESLSDFSTVPLSLDTLDNLKVQSAQDPLSQSKYVKIEKSNKKKKAFWAYAFVDERKEDAFKERFEKGIAALAKRKEREEYYDSEEGTKALKKRYKKERKKGKSMGIDKVVVVNPFYLSLDFRRGEHVQYIRTEEKQTFFRQSIKELSKISNLDAVTLDVTDLSTNDIEKFNDIVEINQYFSQQMDQYEFPLSISYNQKKTNAIAEKYGTDYFLWTGVISLRKKYANKGFWTRTLFAPTSIPFNIIDAATPQYDMLYYAVLFDVKTGRRSIIKMNYFDSEDNNAVLKTHIYDTFHQIKKKPKK